MHLLDAMFYATTGYMTVPLHQSREAELILDRIKKGDKSKPTTNTQRHSVCS